LRLYGVLEEHSQRKDERAECGRCAYAVKGKTCAYACYEEAVF
jgi:hypothetical protein